MDARGNVVLKFTALVGKQGTFPFSILESPSAFVAEDETLVETVVRRSPKKLPEPVRLLHGRRNAPSPEMRQLTLTISPLTIFWNSLSS